MQKGKNRLQNFHLHDKICKLDKTSGKESKKKKAKFVQNEQNK